MVGFASYFLDPGNLLYRFAPEGFQLWLEKRSRPPAGNSYFSSKAKNYDSQRSAQPWWHEENDVISEIVRSLPNLQRVLDVPCGSGRFFPLFVELGFEITGVDSSADMIALAERSASNFEGGRAISLIEGSACSMPFESETFDLVVCVRFLRSIIPFGEAKKVINEIGRVAADWVVLELDVQPDENPRRATIKDSLAMRDGLYLEELENLLEASGLTLREIKRLGSKGTAHAVVLAQRVRDSREAPESETFQNRK